jgi:hypothetical protein
MADERGFRLEWQNLRLRVEGHSDHWDAIVYDVKACLILYKSERITSDAAKVSAVEFALVHLYGPGHGKDVEALAGSPAWHLLSDDE